MSREGTSVAPVAEDMEIHPQGTAVDAPLPGSNKRRRPRAGSRRARTLTRFVRDVVIVGATGAISSAIAAAVCGRAEHGHALRPLNAVSHIWSDSAPPRDEGPGARNLWIGVGLHFGASLFWATFFEAVFGRAARSSPAKALGSGAAISAVAYVTDYHIVDERFRPGYEAHLSGRSLAAIYCALAIGYAVAARATR